MPPAAGAVSFSAFAVEFGPELQIPDSKFQKKAEKDPILNLESAILNRFRVPTSENETALPPPRPDLTKYTPHLIL
jgi:hypothetical protein